MARSTRDLGSYRFSFHNPVSEMTSKATGLRKLRPRVM
jgi:hypothetical protein